MEWAAMNMTTVKVSALIVFLGSFLTAPAALAPTRAFDDFGDIRCEDEMARLDNFAIQLQNETSAKGLIMFYGGRRFRGRLPRRGEGAARAARLKPYLVQRRGIPAERVIVIDGGYDAEWHARLWIVPQGASLPAPDGSIPANQIKFRKGKVSPRQFRCNI
jgi:hypothetical protein